jgi:beta-lactamase superfamily II metal-dependent hydrolase
MKFYFFPLLFSLFTFCDLLQPQKEPSPGITITFIDVGQGLSVLARDNFHHEILYDAGPDDADSAISHVLDSLGVDTLEAFVLSHPDRDHFGGMFGCLKKRIVNKIYWRNFWPLNENNRLVYNFCDSLQMEQQPIYPGDTLPILSGCRIECLWPQLDPFTAGRDSVNDNSIVLKLTNGNVSCILAGDIYSPAESLIALNPVTNLRADLLLANHHGSKFANSIHWLSAIRPTTIIVSCGKNNVYGHPAEEALIRSEAIGSIIQRTDTEGNIAYKANGWGWQKE